MKNCTYFVPQQPVTRVQTALVDEMTNIADYCIKDGKADMLAIFSHCTTAIELWYMRAKPDWEFHPIIVKHIRNRVILWHDLKDVELAIFTFI